MSNPKTQMLERSYALKLMEATGQLRRQLGSASPQAFAEIYLGNHCQLPFSRMHTELFASLADATRKRNIRLAVAAPRGHAKSTVVSLAYVLWSALYENEKHILIISATGEQAVQLLRDVRKELAENPLIQSDFDDILRIRRSPNSRNKTLIGNVMISAYGAGQSLRGAKHRSHRPGLIVVDDLEDMEQVIHQEQRDKCREWFNSTLLKAGDAGTNVIVVGTILHHDSLLAGLIDPAKGHGWDGRKYQAVEAPPKDPQLWERWSAIYRGLDDFKHKTGPDAAEAFFKSNRKKMLAGSSVLWPEREDYRSLMVTREREGRYSFQAEKQNEPIDPEQCIFDESTFQYWDDEEFPDIQHLLEAAQGDHWNFYGACDPSLGRRTGKGDYTGLVILAKNHKTQTHYILAADLVRLKPAQIIDRILKYAEMYRFDRFGVEANQFQSLLLEDLQKRTIDAGIRLNLWRIENRSNKESRIASLEPMISQGKIRFFRRHGMFLDQLRQFPLGTHDDGPDALEMAIQAGRKLYQEVGPPVIISTGSGLR